MDEKRNQKLALERIEKLFGLVKDNFKEHPERSHSYIRLIRKLAMRHNIRLPREIKRRICSRCHKFLVPGKNSRVRTNERQKSVIVTCLECKNVMRYPYRREKTINKNKKTNINREK